MGMSGVEPDYAEVEPLLSVANFVLITIDPRGQIEALIRINISRAYCFGKPQIA
jgi:hypothetical protein